MNFRKDGYTSGRLFKKASIIQRASEASEADYQSCSIEISDIYKYSKTSLIRVPWDKRVPVTQNCPYLRTIMF